MDWAKILSMILGLGSIFLGKYFKKFWNILREIGQAVRAGTNLTKEITDVFNSIDTARALESEGGRELTTEELRMIFDEIVEVEPAWKKFLKENKDIWNLIPGTFKK